MEKYTVRGTPAADQGLRYFGVSWPIPPGPYLALSSLSIAYLLESGELAPNLF